MTDTNGLLRDAGGARPASDVDALIGRLRVRATKDIAAGWDGDARDRDDAADALVQLRDAEALARGKIAEQMIEIERLKANQRCSAIEQGEVGYPCVFRAEAEAEVARLKEQASAVVVIMPPREPTQEMDDAASNVDRSNLPGIFRRQVWRAMWDASGVAKDFVITGNEP
jgi:hypothetical protein